MKKIYVFITAGIVIIFLIYSMPAIANNILDNHINQKNITYINYTVEYGDTLWDIAADHRTDMDIRKVIWDIKQVNDLPNDKHIQPGDELKIPVPLEAVLAERGGSRE